MLRRRDANLRHKRSLAGRKGLVADRMWREAAEELGAAVRHLSPSLLEFRLGDATAHVRGETTPFANPVAIDIASDKLLSYRLLHQAGLPVPEHLLVRVSALAAATSFLASCRGPCVVKPVQAGGGRGVTGEIRSEAQLRRALTYAGRFDKQALIERQVAGDCYRVLVLDGDVLDVLRRPRPRLRGDGRSTIEQLMLREYHHRIASDDVSGLRPFIVDLDCLFALEAHGYHLDSVIGQDEEVEIKTATNYNGPDQSFTVPPPCPETLAAPARRAAQALGVRLAGVDILASDVDTPLEETGGVVLEVNPIPGLNHHYNVAHAGRATAVAVPILRALLAVPLRRDAPQGSESDVAKQRLV
jgi:cyanophycin synthetase